MITHPAVSVPLPTAFGAFDLHAFEAGDSHLHVALVKGELGDGTDVLVRVHSECLTGDTLGSLRCDCGVQLRSALRAIAAEGRGVLAYMGGHEGRGIGLLDKLRAYLEQDAGADTVEANLRLGFEADERNFAGAAQLLRALGVRSVRLLTNNPAKAAGLRAGGVEVLRREPLTTVPHRRNRSYLDTKTRRLGHIEPAGRALGNGALPPVDVSVLLGASTRAARAHVVLKYAQTLDGRIATATGDSRWISGEAERALSHGLRAACDAVMVGIGTVLADDPQLTVRMVDGASPTRVVLDTTLRIPSDAKILSEDAPTVVLTGEGSAPARREALRARGARVLVVSAGPGGLDLAACLDALHEQGVGALLVEGGARVVTSLLGSGLADRIVVAIASRIIGAGTEAVGPLGITRVADGLPLANRSVHLVGDDLVAAWDVVREA
jgi:GTP cyclohydrolase II